VKIHMR